MMILTERWERSRLARQIASKQSASSLRGNSVSSPSRATSPCHLTAAFLRLPVAAAAAGGVCVAGGVGLDWQREWRVVEEGGV